MLERTERLDCGVYTALILIVVVIVKGEVEKEEKMTRNLYLARPMHNDISANGIKISVGQLLIQRRGHD